MMASTGGKRLCLGVIAGAHGIRGEVRLKSFTAEPEAIAEYGPLETEDGTHRFEIVALRRSGSRGILVASLSGIGDRDAAEALKGAALYVARAQLPELGDDDEYYHADLIGLEARLAGDGTDLGEVIAVHDFGAGDLLEIVPRDGGPSVLVPFTRETVPDIDLRAGRLFVAPPTELPETEE